MSDMWICECNYANSGPVCTHCGRLPPASNCSVQWERAICRRSSSHYEVVLDDGTLLAAAETKRIAVLAALSFWRRNHPGRGLEIVAGDELPQDGTTFEHFFHRLPRV